MLCVVGVHVRGCSLNSGAGVAAVSIVVANLGGRVVGNVLVPPVGVWVCFVVRYGSHYVCPS